MSVLYSISLLIGDGWQCCGGGSVGKAATCQAPPCVRASRGKAENEVSERKEKT